MAERPAKSRKVPQGRAMPDERRSRVAELLALGRTPSEVAEEVGIDRKTVRVWRDEPDVAAQVAEIHAEIREAALARAKRLVGKALDTLEGLLDRYDEAPTQRAAANDVLKLVGMERPSEVSLTVHRGYDLTRLSDEELAQLEALTAKAEGVTEPDDGSAAG